MPIADELRESNWIKCLDSSTSLRSTDLECLERLEKLVEADINAKHQITELQVEEENIMSGVSKVNQVLNDTNQADNTFRHLFNGKVQLAR